MYPTMPALRGPLRPGSPMGLFTAGWKAFSAGESPVYLPFDGSGPYDGTNGSV